MSTPAFLPLQLMGKKAAAFPPLPLGHAATCFWLLGGDYGGAGGLVSHGGVWGIKWDAPPCPLLLQAWKQGRSQTVFAGGDVLATVEEWMETCFRTT